jgi:hypothetical protein
MIPRRVAAPKAFQSTKIPGTVWTTELSIWNQPKAPNQSARLFIKETKLASYFVSYRAHTLSSHTVLHFLYSSRPVIQKFISKPSSTYIEYQSTSVLPSIIINPSKKTKFMNWTCIPSKSYDATYGRIFPRRISFWKCNSEVKSFSGCRSICLA